MSFLGQHQEPTRSDCWIRPVDVSHPTGKSLLIEHLFMQAVINDERVPFVFGQTEPCVSLLVGSDAAVSCDPYQCVVNRFAL